MSDKPHILDTSANWPHQARGRAGLKAAVDAGKRAIVAVAPPGAGKSRVMVQEAVEEVQHNPTGRTLVLVHRKMLLSQFINDVLEPHGIDYGIIAADHEKKLDLSKPVQLASIQSFFNWVVRRGKIDLPPISKVLIDEAHANAGEQARAILYGAQGESATFTGLLDRGAVAIGFTGSPTDLNGIYDDMVDFGNYAELRAVKSHLPVRVYSPEEIDTAGLRPQDDNEYSSSELEKRAPMIIGSAFEWWKKLNPFAEPALLFAPSVPASRWFAHEWTKRGVRVAHIDGDVCLLPKIVAGQLTLTQEESTDEVRREILRMSKAGEIALICNRFVLREAIDMPWIRHGIAATVFGGLATYLQSVGRIQRYHPDYTDKIWQCHGGSYWRHGSPNMNRQWAIGDTNKALAKLRKEKAGSAIDPQQVEGICCPKCKGWRTQGSTCYHCGHTHVRSVRSVRQLDGELKLMRGAVNARKKNRETKPLDKIWLSVLFGSIKAGRTVSSAVALFYARAKKDGHQAISLQRLTMPPPAKDSVDYHRKVADVYPHLLPKGKGGTESA